MIPAASPCDKDVERGRSSGAPGNVADGDDVGTPAAPVGAAGGDVAGGDTAGVVGDTWVDGVMGDGGQEVWVGVGVG